MNCDDCVTLGNRYSTQDVLCLAYREHIEQLREVLQQRTNEFVEIKERAATVLRRMGKMEAQHNDFCRELLHANVVDYTLSAANISAGRVMLDNVSFGIFIVVP